MSDPFINLDMSSGHSKGQTGQGNPNHKRFLKKRRFLEKRGLLKEKQLPHKLPHKKPGQPKNSLDHNRQNRQTDSKNSGHDKMGRLNNNVFHQRRAPDASTRTVTVSAPHQPSTLIVSINCDPNRPRPASSSKGRSSPASHDATKPAKPFIQQHNLLSEYESGLSPAVSAPSYKKVAIDCEMVGTGPKGREGALARCSIVTHDGDVVYDKYIKPPSPVTDYRTRWSGIRREHLWNATPFSVAQKEILKLLHGKIVIGHDIQNDYKALGYCHPKEVTRDTSRIPLLNRIAGFAEKEKASLKRLAQQVLHKDIQKGKRGHSSIEDAKTTMELYRVVEVEYERELAAGTVQL